MNSSTMNWRSVSRAVCLAWLLAGCASTGSGDNTTANASDFALRDDRGREVRLSDYLKKKVVLITFWATWCAPCSNELPALQRLYDKYKAEPFVVLGISMDGPETIAGVVPMTRQLGLSFPILLDQETRVVGLYNPKRAAPFGVLIGLDGNVAKRRDGYSPGDEVDIEREVLALLRTVPGK